jgi:hypothetical protein
VVVYIGLEGDHLPRVQLERPRGKRIIQALIEVNWLIEGELFLVDEEVIRGLGSR